MYQIPIIITSRKKIMIQQPTSQHLKGDRRKHILHIISESAGEYINDLFLSIWRKMHGSRPQACL